MMTYNQRLHDAPDAGLVVSPPYFLPRLAHEFSLSVAPGVSGVLTQAVPADGVVERMTVRIYQGAQLQLRLRPYVIRPRQEEYSLVRFAAPPAKQFLDGDDDFFIYLLYVDVTDKDTLAVWYHNLQATHTYDFRVAVEINYAAGRR